jgi:hypothetical protein
MVDHSSLYAETEARLGRVLAGLRDTLAESERGEVEEFLRVGEYGLALDTLSHILVEEDKTIETNVLHEMDGIAAAMHLQGERFMHDLHDRQHHQDGLRP